MYLFKFMFKLKISPFPYFAYLNYADILKYKEFRSQKGYLRPPWLVLKSQIIYKPYVQNLPLIFHQKPSPDKIVHDILYKAYARESVHYKNLRPYNSCTDKKKNKIKKRPKVQEERKALHIFLFDVKLFVLFSAALNVYFSHYRSYRIGEKEKDARVKKEKKTTYTRSFTIRMTDIFTSKHDRYLLSILGEYP